jgi:hypothetical protein
MKAYRGVAIAALAAFASCPGFAAPSLCTQAERVAFSCSAGVKIVSVCESAAGAPVYRYGSPGKIEIDYPSSDAWRGVTRSGVWAFSGGGGAWLAFHRAAFRYIVYTAIGRGWGEKSGVAVEENGKLLTNLACHGTPVSELGPDFFSKTGILEDEVPFDLP